MSLLEAIVLGIVQGATEFLPISSTAHLRILPAVAGWEDPGTAFTAVTQLGTAVSIVLYFRAELAQMVVMWTRSLWRPELRGELDARLGWYLIVATVPIGVFGLVFADQVETGARDLYLIAAMQIVFGIALLAADRFGLRVRELESVNVRDAVAVGLAQAVALIPGASRAGMTLMAGLAVGLDRQAAARFSFLLSVPAIVLSGVYQLPDALAEDGAGLAPTLVATGVAFVVAYLTIGWFIRFLGRHSVTPFVAYRVVLGIAIFALLGAGVVA